MPVRFRDGAAIEALAGVLAGISAKNPSSLEGEMTNAYKEFSALVGSGKYRQAAELAGQELANGEGASAFWLTRRASALNRASDYEQALVDSRSALAIEPSNPYAILCAADALRGLRRPREALSHYREIATHAKVGGRARAGIFESLAVLGRWQELLDSLAAAPAEERHPWRVKALQAQGKTEEAMSECRQWLAERPDHPPALWELSELEVASDGLETVRARYERLARIPTLPPVYREIYASLCRRAGLPELALEEYQKIGGTVERTRVQKKQAFLMAKTGREGEAIPLLEELLTLDPKDIYLHSSYGAACARVNQIERAIEFYNRLMGIHPEENGLYGRIKRLKKKLAALPEQPGPGGAKS
jgi:tetratricopeptide (TPR) repeat protein